MKKILLVISLILVFVLSCGKSSNSHALLLNLKEEGKSYDPQLANDSTAEIVDSLIGETLIREGEDGQGVPGVAEKWEASKDGLVWTFHLRKNAKWSNGDPITANDFRDGWLRALNPNTAAEYASKLFPIKNAEAYNKGQVKEDAVGIQAVDNYTLKVTLGAPLPYFDSAVRLYTYLPVNTKFLKEVGDKYMTSPKDSISSGAYVIKSWTKDSEIVFEKNPNYWNKDNIPLETVKIKFVADEAALNAFKNNEIDITNITTEQAKEYANDKRLRVAKDGSVWYMTYNMKNKVLANKKIRQALSLAVDREKLITGVLDNKGEAAYTYTTKGVGIYGVSKDFSEEAGKVFPAYNPQKAKQLLAEGLKELGLKKLPTLEMIFNTTGSNKAIAEFIQESMEKNLGIDFKVTGITFKERLARMESKNYEIALAGFNGDYPDAVTYLERFDSKDGNNYSQYVNPKYDATLKIAKNSMDKATRVKAMIELEKMIADDMPVGLLYYRANNKLINPRVKGIVFHPIGIDYYLGKTTIGK